MKIGHHEVKAEENRYKYSKLVNAESGTIREKIVSISSQPPGWEETTTDSISLSHRFVKNVSFRSTNFCWLSVKSTFFPMVSCFIRLKFSITTPMHKFIKNKQPKNMNTQKNKYLKHERERGIIIRKFKKARTRVFE